MNKDVTAKLLGLSPDRRDLPPSCMGGMLQYFDWNQAITAKQKFLLSDRRFGDGSYSQSDFFSGSGTEAPRNSVDYSLADTPRSSHAKQDDVPLAFSTAKFNFPGSNSGQSDFLNAHSQQEDIPSASFVPSKLNFPGSTSQLDFFSGLEAPRNSVDYSLTDTPRASYARAEDVPFGYEFPRSNVSVSPPRRFSGGGTPKKDIMADFESRRSAPVVPPRMASPGDAIAEFESRRKAPGVVARLMGLDALPEATGSKFAKKGSVVAEDLLPPTRSPAGRSASHRSRRSGKESPQHRSAANGASTAEVSKRQPLSPRSFGETLLSPKKPQEIRILYPKQAPSPEGSPLREPSILSRHVEPADHELDRSEFEQLAFRDHPQEKQLQEFKKQFEAKLQPRDRFRVNQLEGSDKEFEDKKILVRERLNEAKKTLGKEQLSEAKRLAARQRLKESKEFLEALEFLQSNRSFFLRFLQEPLSSLARHMQEPDSPQKKHKVDRRSRSPSHHIELKKESLSPRASSRQLEEAKKNREAKLLFRKQQGPKTAAELAMFSRTRASSDGELGQEQSQRESPTATDVDSGPTRIVVLKPTPGRGSPLRSASSPGCSPRPYRFVPDRRENATQSAKDTGKGTRKDVGRSAFEDGPGSFSGQEDGRARFKGSAKDPREIAREIVRQAQESASKKLGKEPKSASTSVVRYRTSGKRVSVSRAGTDSGDVTGSSDGDGSLTPLRLKPFQDSPGRSTSSSPRSKSVEMMTTTVVNREGKKRQPEKIKILQPSALLEEPQPKAMSPLGRNAAIVNMGKPGPPQHQGTSKTRELSKNIVEGLIESALPDGHVLADEKKSGKSSKLEKLLKAEKLSNLPHKGTDEGTDASPRALTRSRSLPNSVLFGDWSSAGTNGRKPSSSVCQSPEIAHQNVSINPTNDSFKLPEEAVDPFRAGSCDGTGSASLDVGHTERSEREASTAPAHQDAGVHQAAGQSEELESSICGHPRPGDLESGSPDPSSLQMLRPEAPFEVRMSGDPVATLASQEHVDHSGAVGTADCDDPEDVTSTAAQSVSAGESKQAPRQEQEIWSFSAEALDSADGASEASVEKGGQPSPVSILDSPFEQESPQSPPSDFTEVRSDLQELRLRLQQLKLDGIQRPRDDLGENELALPLLDKLQKRLTLEPSDSACTSSSTETNPSSPSSQLMSLDQDSFGISSLPCPGGREDDLMYVRDLLVISGHIGGRGASLSRWFSPSRPLDVCLFDKLEDWHASPQAQRKCTFRNNGVAPEQQQRIDAMNRRVLFEIVNEVLLKKLGPYVNQLPWTKTSKLAVCSLPTDRQLVEETWREICTCHMPIEGPNYTLENMVERDLRRGRQWKVFQDEIEQVGIELERYILSDMLEEAIRELLSVRTQGDVQHDVCSTK